MEKKKNRILRYIIGICLFSFLLLTAGRERVYAGAVCNIQFSGHSELNTSVLFGTKFYLPEVKSEAGINYVGWDDRSTGIHPFGSTVIVKGNVTFYLVAATIPEYKVTFANNSGGTNASYQKMGMTVPKGSEITLPECGTVEGYLNMGWTTSVGKSTPLYAMGSKYKIIADTAFYIVRKRAYTAAFADNDGTAGVSFFTLNHTVATGSTINLPQGPSISGKVFKGWSLTSGATSPSYKAGDAYTISKNVTFYAVYTPCYTIKYLSNDGSKVLKTVSVEKGSSLTLSGYFLDGYTMMGWSTSAKQTLAFQYQVRDKITPTGNLNLYAVLFNKKNELNYTDSTIPPIDTKKYTKVILVGDSRTALMKTALESELSSATRTGLRFVSKRGSGLDWLKDAGYTSLLSQVGSGGTKAKPIAIVFNSGVNDLLSISDYITFMKKIAPELKAKNCVLYYMSVNPVNNVVLTGRGLNIPEDRLRSFNTKIKSSLCTNGDYKYIDTYTRLYKKGFGHDNGSGVDDGLHFTTRTYKHIYAYIVNTLNNDAAKR